MAETTINSSAKLKPNYKALIDEGLRELERFLQRIDHNQAETAQLRAETQQVAARIRERMKEF